MAETQMQRLVTQLVADTREWRRGMQVASSELKTFQRTSGSALSGVQSGFSKLGASIGLSLSVGGLLAFSRAALGAMDDLGDAAAAAGLGVEQFQRLRHAMSFSGISAEEFAAAMNTATRQTGALLQGQERVVKQFGAIGVSAHDANGQLKSQGEIIDEVIERLGSYGSHAERVRVASLLFGESIGSKLVAFAEQGKGAIEALKAEMVALTEEQIRGASAVQDKLDRFEERARSALNRGLLAVLKEVTQAVELFSTQEIIAEIERVQNQLGRMRASQMEGGVPEPLGTADAQKKLADLKRELALRERKAYEQSPAGRTDRQAADDLAAGEADAKRAREAAAAAEKRTRKEVLEDIARGEERARTDQRNRELRTAEERVRDREKARQKEADEERARVEDETDFIIAEDKKRAAARQEAFEQLQKTAAATFADLATNGAKAFDRLKERILAGLAEIAMQWAAGTLARGAGGEIDWTSVLGDLGMHSGGGGSGFAAGGSPRVGRAALVGERGPELFVPQTAGVIVPSGRFSVGGGGGGSTSVHLGVEVSIEPGMSATQTRRRGLDGREQVRIAVRSGLEDDLSRRGSVSRGIAAELGTRPAPRRGIS